jgi:carboxymethylenebutenolidase
MSEQLTKLPAGVASEPPRPLTQEWIDQRIFDLYDEYCHGHIDRREFLARAALVTGGLAMAQALMPRYALAQTISFTDSRIKARYVS